MCEVAKIANILVDSLYLVVTGHEFLQRMQLEYAVGQTRQCIVVQIQYFQTAELTQVFR